MRIEIPKAYKDVTIKQYAQLVSLRKKYTEDYDDFDVILEIIAIMSGANIGQLSEVGTRDIMKVWKALSFLDTPPDNIKMSRYLNVNRIDYIADFDVTKMKAGQYIDFKHYLKTGDVIGNLHNILAIFYIPVLKKYGDRPQPEVAEDFYNNVSIDVAYSASVFFCNLLIKWMSPTNQSIGDQIRQTMAEVFTIPAQTIETHSLINGDGTQF